jgi:hypothetical protein
MTPAGRLRMVEAVRCGGALDDGAHRTRARGIQGHGIQSPGACRPEPLGEPGSTAAAAALRTRSPRRAAAHRYQEAWEDREGRSSNHGKSARFGRRCGLGVRLCLHRCPQFLRNAVVYYRHLGVEIERVMTDNGPAFRSRNFAQVREEFGIRHIFTRAYTPQTNGKAERFIQTALREWAYAAPTAIPTRASPPCRASCTATIGTALIAEAAIHPSADSALLGTTC